MDDCDLYLICRGIQNIPMAMHKYTMEYIKGKKCMNAGQEHHLIYK